jgi:hypothetical protein
MTEAEFVSTMNSLLERAASECPICNTGNEPHKQNGAWLHLTGPCSAGPTHEHISQMEAEEL